MLSSRAVEFLFSRQRTDSLVCSTHLTNNLRILCKYVFRLTPVPITFVFVDVLFVYLLLNVLLIA